MATRPWNCAPTPAPIPGWWRPSRRSVSTCRRPSCPVTRQSPLEELLAVAAATEQGFDGLFGALLADVPAAQGIETRSLTITGVDGNDITLYVHRPIGVSAPLPGLLHLHGGGMAILTAGDQVRRAVARVTWRPKGCVVVGVEFRNSGGALGPHPFPAGLNDCASALDWMHGQREGLGLTSIVVTGESGGGNLSLATALKAKREGRLDHIDGVYAQVPFIYGVTTPMLKSSRLSPRSRRGAIRKRWRC